MKKVKGNLLDLAEQGEFDIVVHGVNCFNTMGGGIAKEIRARYPAVAAVDSLTDRGDYNKLGNWTTAAAFPADGSKNYFTIINAYTQYNMSTGEDVFEYEAFALILRKLIHTSGNLRIGLPYIGMGLAGGNKDIIIPIIEDFAEKVAARGGSVTLVEFGV